MMTHVMTPVMTRDDAREDTWGHVMTRDDTWWHVMTRDDTWWHVMTRDDTRDDTWWHRDDTCLEPNL